MSAAADEDGSSGTSSLELISSHLHRLQGDFDRLLSSHQQLQESRRDLLNRVHTLEREQRLSAARIGTIEHWIEFVRNLVRRLA